MRYDLSQADWNDLTAVFLTGLRESLTDVGFSGMEMDAYLRQAGVERELYPLHGLHLRLSHPCDRIWQDQLGKPRYQCPENEMQERT